MDIQALQRFSAGSANDDTHKHLWIQGASQFIPQLNQLLKPVYTPTIKPITTFLNDQHTAEDAWVLGNILKCHLSDKSTTHTYHILYSYILKDLRDKPIKLLEIGLGTNNPDLISNSNGIHHSSKYSTLTHNYRSMCLEYCCMEETVWGRRYCGRATCGVFLHSLSVENNNISFLPQTLDIAYFCKKFEDRI